MQIHILRWNDISTDETVFISEMDNHRFIEAVKDIKSRIKPGSTFSQDKAHVIDELAKLKINAVEANYYTLWRFYN